ncbi:MAG: hypothetical protein ACFCU6_10615, partial [Balneolaceae bacterium]
MDRKKFLKITGSLAAGSSILNPRFARKNNPDRIIPDALKTGDKIAFVAPAGIIFDENDFVRMQRVMELKG